MYTLKQKGCQGENLIQFVASKFENDMRPKRKAKPITIRLFLEEMERFEKVEARFLARHPLGDRNIVIRLWLGLPIKDPKAKLLEEEIEFLAGRITSMQDGNAALIKGVTPALRLSKDRQREVAR